MTYTVFSFATLLIALLLAAGVMLVPVALLAGNVFHVWGTACAWEWVTEATLRIFSGSLRRKVMRRVIRLCVVGVDGSRRAHPNLVMTVSPFDVRTLTSPGGTLSLVASDASKGYARHARTEGWSCGVEPRIAVVPNELVRRGTVRVRPVSDTEFVEARAEMAAYDDRLQADLAPISSADDRYGHTEVLPDDVMTSVPAPHGAARAGNPADAVTKYVHSTQLVLNDAQGRSHEIASASALIGRGHDCGVQLLSAEVSREHVSVYLQDGTWWLRDRGSRNGTVVDGTRVHGTGPVRLRHGSRIVLGSRDAGETLTVSTPAEAPC